jgi:hypothetical protein
MFVALRQAATASVPPHGIPAATPARGKLPGQLRRMLLGLRQGRL